MGGRVRVLRGWRLRRLTPQEGCACTRAALSGTQCCKPLSSALWDLGAGLHQQHPADLSSLSAHSSLQQEPQSRGKVKVHIHI